MYHVFGKSGYTEPPLTVIVLCYNVTSLNFSCFCKFAQINITSTSSVYYAAVSIKTFS